MLLIPNQRCDEKLFTVYNEFNFLGTQSLIWLPSRALVLMHVRGVISLTLALLSVESLHKVSIWNLRAYRLFKSSLASIAVAITPDYPQALVSLTNDVRPNATVLWKLLSPVHTSNKLHVKTIVFHAYGIT